MLICAYRFAYTNMKNQSTSNEHIKAEAAAYIAEKSMPWSHAQLLKKDLAGTAFKLLSGETVITEVKSAITDRIDRVEHTSESYIEYLQSLSPEQRQVIGFMANKMQAYEPFRSAVETMLTNASENSDNHLGSGSNGSVYKLTIDSVDYAVKKGGVSHFEMSAFRRGENIEGISHLVALDIDNSVGIMNYVPGNIPEKLSKEEMESIPESHIRTVIDKVIEMYDAGLQIDPKASNFLYDRQSGFGVIDYYALGEKWSKSDQVFSLLNMLTTYDDVHEFDPHAITMINKFLDLIEREYPDILDGAVADNIRVKEDPRIGSTAGPTGINIYRLPPGEPYDAFKERVVKLHLEGMPPRDIDFDFEYESDTPIVIK